MHRKLMYTASSNRRKICHYNYYIFATTTPHSSVTVLKSTHRHRSVWLQSPLQFFRFARAEPRRSWRQQNCWPFEHVHFREHPLLKPFIQFLQGDGISGRFSPHGGGYHSGVAIGAMGCAPRRVRRVSPCRTAPKGRKRCQRFRSCFRVILQRF